MDQEKEPQTEEIKQEPTPEEIQAEVARVAAIPPSNNNMRRHRARA